MRKYTLAFSILVHAVVVAVVIISPALATGDLPEPRRASMFVIVRPAPPPVPPSVRPRVADRPSRAAAPIEPPPEVRPEIEEPLDPPGVDSDPLSSLPVGIGLPVGEPAPLPAPPPPPNEPVRVGGVIEAPTKIHHVDPVYPPIALAARKEGVVILEALIGEDGVVREVRVLRPAQLLDEAAIEAVRQWRFTPTLLNGEPVPIVMTVTVGFSLKQ